ncbi:LysR family transcriptional regulator [Arthrobacter citreus]|nr:LysR family transcriptional regulator [Arthrobacter citreus]
MNIEQLRHLFEVLESGSFIIAAKKFNLSETDIKESIISLEIELGVRLIECDMDSKVIPSFEGLQIIPIIKDIVWNIKELEEEIKAFNNKSSVNRNLMYDVSIL